MQNLERALASYSVHLFFGILIGLIISFIEFRLLRFKLKIKKDILDNSDGKTHKLADKIEAYRKENHNDFTEIRSYCDSNKDQLIALQQDVLNHLSKK